MNDSPVILKGVGGLYSVYDSGNIYSCVARGILRKENMKPLTGDRVVLSQKDEEGKTAVIDDILPRKNQLVRPYVANIDKLFLVIAVVSPAPDLYLIDKMLITAELQNVEPVLVINKSDRDQEAATELMKQYSNAAKCFMTSASLGIGTEEVLKEMDGAVSVLAGQSGVGKSTILNLAAGEGLMETGGVSDKTQRGKHTTRHAEIFPIRDELVSQPSFIIDSPGFSLFDLNISSGDLCRTYPEVYNHMKPCRFQDCSHTGEPGCFVPELISQGILHKERYNRYCELYKELRTKEKNKYR